MARRPRRHGAGNPQIIMPAAQTIIEPASFLIHDLEISQLLIGPTAHLIIHYPHVTAFHFGEIVLNQCGAANGIDQNCSARHLLLIGVQNGPHTLRP